MLPKLSRFIPAVAAAVAISSAAGSATADAEKHRWKMQSAFPSSLVHVGPMGKHFIETVKIATGGTVDIRFNEPGALVPALQILDSVSQGAIDSGYSAASYNVGKLPQAALFNAFPFGPGPGMYLAWLKHGGGMELYDKMYAPLNVKGLVCFMYAPEAGGWYRKEIKSVEDLKGLKMRFAGLGARVIERFGVSTQLLAAGDIYPALELGTIDAADLGMPAADLSAGLYQVAKYYYFPGWHQQTTFHEFLVNMDKWKALSDEQRAQINVACDATIAYGFADSEAINPPALIELAEKGTEIRVFPDEVLQKLEAAWEEVAQEQAEQSPEFKEVWTSLKAFRERYDSWGDKAYLR